MKRTFLSLLFPALAGTLLTAQAQEVVFEQDFVATPETEQWQSVDVNADGITWGAHNRLWGLVYDGRHTQNAANDWTVSPTFQTKAGSHYMIELAVSQRGCFQPDSLTVGISEDDEFDVDNVKMVEGLNVGQLTGIVTYRVHYLASTTGDTRLGLFINSPAKNGVLSVKSVRIISTTGQQPIPAPDMTAYADGEKKEVRLRWYNPNRDTDGAIISRPMQARIYVDGQEIETVDNLQPGEMTLHTLRPASFSGKHEFGVALVLDGQVSDIISRSLDLNDFKGEMVELLAFPLNNKNDFASWKVQNGDSGNAWEYDYRSVYLGYNRAANDWLFTPVANLEQGKRYILTYEAKSNVGYPASFDVTLGTAQDSASHTQVLAQQKQLEKNGYGTFQTPQFEVSADGEYYFGFHATEVKNQLSIRNVKLQVMQGSTTEAGEETLPVWTAPVDVVTLDTLNAGLTDKVPYHQRLSAEGVELYASLTHALIDEYTLAPNGIYHLEEAKKYQPQLQGKPDFPAEFAGGIVYHKGRIYANEYIPTGNYQEAVPVWKILDAKTLEVISQNNLKSNCENTTISMAYYTPTDKIYGFVKDYTDTWFVEINPADGEMRRIGDKMDPHKRFLTIGSNYEGDLYAIYLKEDYVTGDQSIYLCRVEPTEGKFSEMGLIQGANLMADDNIYNMKYRQALFCDNSTGKFYWMCCGSSLALGSQYAPIYELDPTNAVATLRTWATNVYAISGAYFEEPMMESPASIVDLTFTPASEGATEGVISFALPEKSYNGKPLTGTVHYEVTEPGSDEPIEFSGDGQPGEVINQAIETTQGLHTLSVVVSNAAGASPAVERKFLIGYDLPAAPQNVVLTAEGRQATVTWEAPAAGINGGVYDASKLTYTVMRFPGYEVVASGLTETTFTETLPGQLSRYAYGIYSCHDGEPIKNASSNMIVIGDALQPPYGGVFEGLGDFYNYYTIIDANNDGHTWTYHEDSHSAFYPYNYAQAANDWLISPPLQVEEGRVYTLIFSAFSSHSEFLESMLVTFGYDRTPVDNRLVLDLEEVPAMDEQGGIATYEVDMLAEQSGTAFYAFQCYSPKYHEYLFLHNIQFKDRDADGISSVKKHNSTFLATPQKGQLLLVNPSAASLRVVGASGQTLFTTSEANAQLPLAPGIYVVTDGTTSQKVVVK